MSVATRPKGQPVVDESEAATVAPVTTSTVKHDVTAKITVHEGEEEVENGNSQDQGMTHELEVIFAEATPVIESATTLDPAHEDHVQEDAPTVEVTAERKAQLAECEMKITRGLATFVEVGMALAYILLNRLYLLEYKTWVDYLDIRWGFTKQRAFQYMSAADGHQRLSTQIAGNRRLPQSERGMRELLKVSDDNVIDVLDKLGDKGELTADRISKVREEVQPKKASAKGKKKPVIKIEAAIKAVGVWTAFLGACDLASLTEQQRKDLQKANKTATDKFNKLSIAA